MKSLQARFLAAIICIGIVPFTLAGILLIHQERNALKMQASRELIGLAQGLSAELDNQLQGLLQEARVMAALPDMAGANVTEQKQLLRLLHEQYNKYGQLALVDLSGQVLVASTDMELINISHIVSFQQAAAGQQAWTVAPALFDSKLVLHLHTPIRNTQGEVVGVLGSPIPFPSLAATLKTLSSAGRQAFVLDSSGSVLIHPETAEAERRQSYAAWIIPTFHRSAITTGETIFTHGDASWIAGYATVPGYNWTIVVQRPEQDVLKPASVTQSLAFSALCTSVMLAVLAAVAVAHNLTRPVRHLADAARALGAGGADVPLPQDLPQESEVGALVQAFAAMRRAVIERERSLRTEIEMRERAEEQIRRHQSAMAASIDGMALLDQDDLIYVNDALVKLYGYESERDLLGKSWRTFYSPQEQERFMQEVVPILNEQGLWRGEAIGTCRDGKEFCHEISIALTDTGELVAVIHDLSERRLSEEMLRQTQKLESLGLLAGGIAHDFNNLLAAMMGQITLAIHKLSATEPARKHIEKALTSTERAADLTRQLLAYAGRGSLQQEVLDLNQLVKDNVHLVETALPSRAHLVLHLASSLPPVKADRGQLQQVIMNLLINAAEAIRPTGGAIGIRTALEHIHSSQAIMHRTPQRVLEPPAAGTYVVLEISDSGCGMDAQTLERIFDPFFTTKAHGNGLGLSATLGIIHKHRGHMVVESQPGRGSIFRVLIPISIEPVQQVPFSQPKINALGGSILVIDDDKSIIETTQSALELLGIDTYAAVDGYGGVSLFQQYRRQIDAVILDMKMPQIGGEETLRRLRAIDPTVPVILSSGYTESEIDRLLAQDVHLYFLGKPYTFQQLAQMLEAILTTHRKPQWKIVEEAPPALTSIATG